MSVPKRLFVLMPFGNSRKLARIDGDMLSPGTCHFDQWFERVLRPAGERAGLVVFRADQERLTGEVMAQVWRELKNADLVLAFLTGLNPNVLYEVGLAHSLRKPTLLIIDDKQTVPFDLAHLRLLKYDREDLGLNDNFRDTLAKTLEEIAQQPDSAILKLFD